MAKKLEELQREVAKMREKGEKELQRSFNYLHTKGDIMLELVLDVQNTNCSLELKLRERPIHWDGKKETDILKESGILVAERQRLCDIQLYETSSPSMVNIDGAYAERQHFIDAVFQIFAVIKAYEQNIVNHPSGYAETGIGRHASVSVTGLDRFKQLGIEELSNLPDTYNTIDEKCRDIQLPGNVRVKTQDYKC